MQCDTFVVGTQRGFAAGLVISGTGTRMVERFFRCKDWTKSGIDAAYAEASTTASRLLATVNQCKTTSSWTVQQLIKDWGKIPGDIFAH